MAGNQTVGGNVDVGGDVNVIGGLDVDLDAQIGGDVTAVGSVDGVVGVGSTVQGLHGELRTAFVPTLAPDHINIAHAAIPTADQFLAAAPLIGRFCGLGDNNEAVGGSMDSDGGLAFPITDEAPAISEIYFQEGGTHDGLLAADLSGIGEQPLFFAGAYHDRVIRLYHMADPVTDGTRVHVNAAGNGLEAVLVTDPSPVALDEAARFAPAELPNITA